MLQENVEYTQENEPNFYKDFQNLVDSIGTITKNEQGFGYSYLDIVKLYDVVMPKLKENNFVVLSTVRQGVGEIERRDTGVIAAKDKDGNPSLVATREFKSPCYNVHTELFHLPTKTMIECDLPLYVDDIDPQALGSAITYMRRYSLFVLLGIKTQDDDGASASVRYKTRVNTEREPLPADPNEIGNFLMHHTNPKIYYGELVNRKDIEPALLKKLKKIMYPD